MRVIIYCILNLINFHCYVGQTIKSCFNLRYSGGRWWDESHNEYLKNAAKYYGIENFIVLILEENVESLIRLNELEIFHIKQCNSRAPYGYNLEYGGDNKERHIETSKKCSLLRRQVEEYKFRSPEGEIIEVEILSHFCKKYKLSLVLLCHIYLNLSLSKLHGNIKIILKYKLNRFYFGRKFPILNIRGKLKEFCIKYNLKYESVTKLWKEKILEYKGWKKFKEVLS